MEEVPPAADGRQKFVDYCRLLYQKNSSILQSIDQFERDYKSTDAVRWYTREGFLYKVLNQALREQNSKTLRLMHFFVFDLNRQLTDALKNKEDPYQMWTSRDSQLYRGQLISRVECELMKRSVGEIMFTNSFLSTTMDHDVTLMFSGAGAYALESSLQPILFHLDCSAWRPVQDVANVQELSFNADETEILFSPTHNMILTKFEYDEALHVWKAHFTQDLESMKDDVHRGFYDDQRLIKLELAVAYLQQARQTEDDMDDGQSSSDDDDPAECIFTESSLVFAEGLQLLIKELVLPPLASVTLTERNKSPVFVLETLRSFTADSLSHEPDVLPDMVVTLYDSPGTIYKNKGKFLLAYHYYHRASTDDKPTSPTSYTRKVYIAQIHKMNGDFSIAWQLFDELTQANELMDDSFLYNDIAFASCVSTPTDDARCLQRCYDFIDYTSHEDADQEEFTHSIWDAFAELGYTYWYKLQEADRALRCYHREMKLREPISSRTDCYVFNGGEILTPIPLFADGRTC